jgi:fructuronate reductase
VHDLAHPDAPVSTIGILVAGFRKRRSAPLTLMSCDNLPHNGRTLKGIVLDFAARMNAETARRIEREVAFPCSMVDRIVPPTTPALIAETAAALGVQDEAPVACEPFTQWVIEDQFAAGRPAWHEVGAEIVSDVAPYEEMKLRMLNGSHSLLAYLGYLGGYEIISEVMRDKDYVRLARDMMQKEVVPTLKIAGSYDLAAYEASILERFANPALSYRCDQVAMDGSQKLPQRLLATIRANRAAGRPARRLALAVAAWMRFVMGTDEQGRAIPIRDPLAEVLAQRVKAAGGEPTAIAGSLLGIETIFGTDLPANAEFRKEVSSALALLLSGGARATVHQYCRTAG